MDEFLKEENYLDYGRLARKLVGMDLVYANPSINMAPDALKVWKELASNQEELLNFVQDETQSPRSRAKAFWLLMTMYELKNCGKSDIQVSYPVVADVHILLRLFLKLFETDTTFHVWQQYYTDYVSNFGDVAIPYFYKHLDNHWLAPEGAMMTHNRWLEPYVMFKYRYADYAAWCIERITKIPLNFAPRTHDYPIPYENTYGGRAEKIAIFKTKLQAYCAERGIALE